MYSFKQFRELQEAPAEPYVVIHNYGRGQQEIHPSNEDPQVYSQKEAERIVAKETRSNGRRPFVHAKPLTVAADPDAHFVTARSEAMWSLQLLKDRIFGKDDY